MASLWQIFLDSREQWTYGPTWLPITSKDIPSNSAQVWLFKWYLFLEQKLHFGFNVQWYQTKIFDWFMWIFQLVECSFIEPLSCLLEKKPILWGTLVVSVLHSLSSLGCKMIVLPRIVAFESFASFGRWSCVERRRLSVPLCCKVALWLSFFSSIKPCTKAETLSCPSNSIGHTEALCQPIRACLFHNSHGGQKVLIETRFLIHLS